MGTNPSHSMQSVTLRQGESISLLTGQVFAPATRPGWELPRYVELRLIANDPNALRSAFRLTSCAWTERACHEYVDHCPQHPFAGATRPGPLSTVISQDGGEVTIASRIDANDPQALSEEFYVRAAWGWSHLHN